MPLAHKQEAIYTYGDYLTWPDEKRWEIIHGLAYGMSPAPDREHQKISRELLGQFWDFLKDKTCDVYHAPFDVRLPEGDEKGDEIKTVVQPDLLVVCDPVKLDKRGCLGAPDLVIEILSPSTASKDLKEKLNLYEYHGVKEYWVVHPQEKIVMVFEIEKTKKYGRPHTYSKEDKIQVDFLKGLDVDLSAVFAE